MRLYLAGESALELLRYLRSVNGSSGLGGTAVRRRTLNDAINTTSGLEELDNTAQLLLSHVSQPIHVFVGSQPKSTKTKKLVTHLLSTPMDAGFFLDLGHGICISTPQFIFTQLAAEWSFVDTVSLGMELCGGYSRWRMAPGRMGDPFFWEPEENRDCTMNLLPVTKARYLAAFIERVAGLRGVVRARAAVRWLQDNSASPMETATYLLLCLPRRVGGYGLPQPVLNAKLTLRNAEGVHVRYPDLFWETGNIDVEYNSDQAHSGEWSRYHDSKREVELVVADVKVLPLTRPQLMNVDEFDVFAHGVRKLLGLRWRTPDAAWESKRAVLRRALLPVA